MADGSGMARLVLPEAYHSITYLVTLWASDVEAALLGRDFELLGVGLGGDMAASNFS